MKLFSLTLLAATAVAVAVPAPQAVSSPDARQSTNLTLEPNSTVTINSPPLSDFWTYSLTITESYSRDKLVVICDFQNAQGRHKFDFVNDARILMVKVTDLWLFMQYDYNKHWATYAYGDYHWGMDMYSATTHGFCNSEDGWNKAPLQKNSYDFRQIQLSCWIYLGNQALATQSKIGGSATRAVSRQADDVPGPHDTVLYNVTFTPNSPPATGDTSDLPPYYPGFWVYDVTVTEGWVGKNLVVTAVLTTGAGAYPFTFTPDKMNWVHINKKYLQMTYNYYEHRIWFKYDGYEWALDMYSGSPHGLCKVLDNWNKPALPEGSQELRQITSECWIYVVGNEESASARRNIENIAARDISTPSNVIMDTNGYYRFDLSITEYCEASEGTPLKARAYWTPHSAPGGVLINFDDGNVVTKVDIGYATKLQVGTYDYWTHRVHFRFGGCNWDQDTAGVASCGYCFPSPWSSGELNCAANAAAGRFLHLDCYTAVIFDTASEDQPKLLAARTDLESMVTAESHATVTRTEVPEIIATGTTPGTSSTTILPFHVSVTEGCENGSKKVTAHYQNGHMSADMTLWPDLQVGIDHRVPNFPPFVIGPLEYNTSRLRFYYSSSPIRCEWFDDETWKQCGECRAARWSGPAVNCAAGGSRTKEMDCSFILGT